MAPSNPLDPQALLSHTVWVRRLAGQLVAGALADDVAQETLMAAWVRPPQERADLRGWLAQVARRTAARLRRREARQSVREQRAALGEALEPTDELVARAELERSLVDAVLALDEPWRRTVLLRWFDGRPPRVIAREMGVPVETVRTRLQRAMEWLRDRLIAERCAVGDAKSRRELAGLLLVVAGGVAMSAIAKSGLVAAGVVAAAFVGWDELCGSAQPVVQDTSLVAAVSESLAESDETDPVAVARVAAEQGEESNELPAAAGPVVQGGVTRIVGTVLDAVGQPVEGAFVFAELSTAPRFLRDEIEFVSGCATSR